jgi:hypothetical protein
MIGLLHVVLGFVWFELLKPMQESEKWIHQLNLQEVKRQVENALIVTAKEFGKIV